MIGAALIRGNAGDVNQNKTTGRLVLLGNTDLLQPRPNQTRNRGIHAYADRLDDGP